MQRTDSVTCRDCFCYAFAVSHDKKTLVDKQVQKIKMIKISLNLRLDSIVSIDLCLDDPIDAINWLMLPMVATS